MELAAARRRFAEARSATLATIGPTGPHLVPIVFAVLGDRIISAVDHKPKRTTQLRRLDNIAADPRVSVLADRYSEDWTRLWWVRADGRAGVIAAADATAEIDALAMKYEHYRERRPHGAVIIVQVDRWRAWDATDPDPR